MAQFKTNANLLSLIKKKALARESETFANRLPQSPRQSRVLQVKAPQSSSYQTLQRASTTEYFNKKTNGRVKFEESSQQKYTKVGLKASFEESQLQYIESPYVPKLTAAGNKENQKAQKYFNFRVSLDGGSPNVSSNSSKQLSNRSSNISQTQKTLKGKSRTLNQKPLFQSSSKKVKEFKKNDSNLKITNPEKTYLLPSKTRGSIADEKQDKTLKQAIMSTPKFSEYYSMIDRSQSGLRNMSLAKHAIPQEIQNYQPQQKSSFIEKPPIPFVQQLRGQSHSSCSQHEDKKGKASLIQPNPLKAPKKQPLKLKKNAINFKKNKSHIQQVPVPPQKTENPSHKITSQRQARYPLPPKMDINHFQLVQSPRVQQKQSHYLPDSPLSVSNDESEEIEEIKRQSIETTIERDCYTKTQMTNESQDQLVYRYYLNEDTATVPNTRSLVEEESTVADTNAKRKRYGFPMATLKQADRQKPCQILSQRHFDKRDSEVSSTIEVMTHTYQKEPVVNLRDTQYQKQLFRLCDSPSGDLTSKANEKVACFDGQVTAVQTFREMTQRMRSINSIQNSSPKNLIRNQSYTNAKRELLYVTESSIMKNNLYNDYEESSDRGASLDLETLELTDNQLQAKLKNQNSKVFRVKGSFASLSKQQPCKDKMNNDAQEDTIALIHPRSALLSNNKTLKFILEYLPIKDMNKIKVIFKQRQFYEEQTDLSKLIVATIRNQDCLAQSSKQLWLQRFKVAEQMLTKKGYFNLLSKKKSACDFEIEKDIERTFPHDPKFNKGSSYHNKLFQVLKALAIHEPEIGYVQGFNFIVGNLLKVVENAEQVFWIFLGLLHDYKLDEFYKVDMPGLKLAIYHLHCFISNLIPEVDLYLQQQSILVEYFASQWLITLFSYDFEVQMFQQVINMVILEGPQVLIQISLSLVDSIKEELLGLPMEQALVFLKELPMLKGFDYQQVLEKAFQFKDVTPSLLKKLDSLYRRNKRRRVLFIREQETQKIYIKVLPILPEDEQQTDCNVDDDSFDHDLEFSNGKKKINNSFYLNSASVLDVRENPNLVTSGVHQEIYLDNVLCRSNREQIRDSLGDTQPLNNQNILQIEQSEIISDTSSPHRPLKRLQTTQVSSNVKRQIGKLKLKELDSLYVDIEAECSIPELASQPKPTEVKAPTFVQSPSQKIIQSPFVKKSERLSPGMQSEDINESEYKDQSKREGLCHNIRKLKSLSQLKGSHESILDDTVYSHNVSNIEEFLSDSEKKSNRFQQTQRMTTRREHQEDLIGRDTLQRQISKSKPFNQELQVQFDKLEIERQGSHLNTPNFQQTGRSNTILQEKRINNPLSSFDFKKNALIANSKRKTSENKDPNAFATQAKAKAAMPTHRPQKFTYNPTHLASFKQQSQSTQVNNFQRFSATQKNPMFAKKTSERYKNKVLHNWSHQASDSSNTANDIVGSMKSPSKPRCRLNKYQLPEHLMSPRIAGASKQSQKISGHQGDMFCEEADMTTIVTPKDSFYMPKPQTTS